METRILFTRIGSTLAKAAVIIGLAGLMACPQTAHAFDTGPHHDLTENAMGREGFGNTAIEVAQVNNWFTDYYSDGHPQLPTIEYVAAKLHFDNMPDMNMSNSTHINNYWTHLSANTKTSIQKAAQNGDVLRALTILGVSLHTVQDFYSHSNWVEAHPKSPHGPLRTETWFNSQPFPMTTDIHTGHYPNLGGYNALDHGDAIYGINHDAPGTSPTREHFKEAYVFAYVGSQEWIQVLHQWVDAANPGFWNKMQTYNVFGLGRTLLDYDSTASYRVSEWLPGEGHWGGPGSASLLDFAAFMAGYMPIVTPYETEFLDVLKSGDLTNGLTGGSPAMNAPVVPGYLWAFEDRVVSVRTLAVDAKSNTIDWLSQADFYASIGIAGQTFTMATQQGENHIAPNWTALKVLPWANKSADISYTLLDEDSLGAYEICDINPDPWNCGLNFNIDFLQGTLTGAATGLHDTPATAIVRSGQVGASNRSQVALTIKAEDMRPATTIAWKQMNVTAIPGAVVFNLKTQHNKYGDEIPIEQSGVQYITIHAVDAKTGLPVDGEVYYDSPSQDAVQLGVTNKPFPLNIQSGSESHRISFKVWASGWQGYNPAVTSINVEVNLPEN